MRIRYCENHLDFRHIYEKRHPLKALIKLVQEIISLIHLSDTLFFNTEEIPQRRCTQKAVYIFLFRTCEKGQIEDMWLGH